MPSPRAPRVQPHPFGVLWRLHYIGIIDEIITHPKEAGRGGGHLQVETKGFLLMSPACCSVWLTRGMLTHLNSESPNKQPDSFEVLTQIKRRTWSHRPILPLFEACFLVKRIILQ